MARNLTQAMYARASVADRSDVLQMPITNKTQAGMFIRWLHATGLEFHFEDDPADIFNVRTNARTFTDKEVPLIRARVEELYACLKDPIAIALKVAA